MNETTKQLDEPGRPHLHTFRSSDGYEWHYRHYRPSGQARARLVCIHGIQSHGGWYSRSCSQLADAGFEVYFLDRRGSGLNSVARGDMPSFRRVLDDYAEFLKSLPKEESKTFLICISWGGKLGVGLNYRHPNLVEGLVLVCPGFFATVRPSFFQRLKIGRARIRFPARLFPIPLNDPALFTASLKWQEYLRQDPLALREATARLLFNSVTLDIYLKRARKRMHLPVLLLLAEKDQIIHNDKVRNFVERFPSTDKTILEYPAAHHTLEFEPEGHPFVRDIVTWVEKRI